MRRAIIYCRVSTDEEVQMNALENQIKEAKQAIVMNHWVLVGQYIDEGKSGTTTKRRNEYNRLIEDISQNKFDIIVVKSQDRLMRNTKEWYVFVDKLVQSGKQLYFYLENTFYTPDDALITGIKAILAEEYSRELSKKINNAHRHRQSSGSTVLITSNTWGYDKKGKAVVINREEAEIVRLIYDLYLQGNGSRTISRELQSRGIRSRNGGRFSETTIRRIIRNPLFMGTAVMNKRHMDFNTKKTHAVPKEEWIVHKAAVPPIIDEETWRKANEIMDRRALVEKTGEFAERRRGRNSGKYSLSGKIICGMCGNVYWRRHRKNTKGEQLVDWSCAEYVQRGRTNNPGNIKPHSEGGCDNTHINDRRLTDALYEIAGRSFHDKPSVLIEPAIKILEAVFLDGGREEIHKLRFDAEKISGKRELLLDKYLEGHISDDIYKCKDSALKEEYEGIRTRLRSMDAQKSPKKEQLKRLDELKSDITDIAEKDLRVRKLLEYVESIVVYPTYADVRLGILGNARIYIDGKQYKTEIMRVKETPAG